MKQVRNLIVKINDTEIDFSNASFISIIKVNDNGIDGLYEMGVCDSLFEQYDTVINTNELNKDQIKSILLKNPNSYIKKYNKILQKSWQKTYC